ncbi:MAG TPA: hypothetical protein VN436_04180 [Holophaga sp.]|nr:hypothetical protein [Holophaga sp.]
MTKRKMGRPITLPGIFGDLARAVGGVGALAGILGVAPRTIHGWAKRGRIPRGPARTVFEVECREAGLEPPTWKGEEA